MKKNIFCKLSPSVAFGFAKIHHIQLPAHKAISQQCLLEETVPKMVQMQLSLKLDQLFHHLFQKEFWFGILVGVAKQAGSVQSLPLPAFFQMHQKWTNVEFNTSLLERIFCLLKEKGQRLDLTLG